MLRKIGKKTKTIAITAFLLILTPTLVYFVSDLDETFDSRSKASGLKETCDFDPISDSTLSEYSLKKDINIGATLQECFKEDNTQKDLCKKILAEEYSGMRLAFQTSWRLIEKKKGIYDYTAFDEMIKFAKDNDLKLQYHHLIWSKPLNEQNSFYPQWLFPGVERTCGKWTKAELLAIMKEHITSIVKRGEDTVVAWNVVNEAFTGDGTLEENCFTKIIGEDYIYKAFEYAREASPDGLLVLNETFPDSNLRKVKVDSLVNYIKTARQKGIPIDALGLQNHLRATSGKHFDPQYLEQLQYFFDETNKAGIQVLITEMDIYQAGHTQEEVASLYKKVMAMCLESDNCTSLTTWGISDQYSWLRNDKIKLPDAKPLLFDENYKRKSSYIAIMEALQENTTRGCTNKVPSNTIKLNTAIWSNFKEKKLDSQKWEIYKSVANIEITQTSSNTLRIAIPGGSDKDKIKYGGIISKTEIPSDSDFRATVSLYKPAIYGDGEGETGISFTSAKQDTSIKLYWLTSKTSSKLILTAKLPDGKTKEYGKVSFRDPKVEIRLIRIGNEYIAKYKLPEDDDSKLITIGKVTDSELSFKGSIRIFSNNAGTDNKFPAITTKIDSTSIAWFDKTLSEKEVLFDNFSGLTVSPSKWRINLADKTSATISDLKYLLLNISAGSNNGKPRIVSIESKEIIPEGKNFSTSTVLIRPLISGDGIGEAGLQFVSLSTKEKAVIKWTTGTNTNKLIFIVEDQDGKEIFSDSIDLLTDVKEIQCRIKRDEDGYVAMYKEGTDTNVEYKTFAKKIFVKSSSNGKIRLFASNRGTDNKYPGVKGRFDKASLSYYK